MAERDNIEALEREILAEADRRGKELTARAERVVSRIDRNASRKAEEIRREAERRAAPKIEHERVRALAMAELEAKREEARLREQLVESVFEAARAELSHWRSRPDRLDILARLVAEAADALPGSRLAVELDREDVEALSADGAGDLSSAVSRLVGRKVDLTVAAAERRILGGARVTAEDGRSRVDQTFESRLDRVAADLRREVHREVFASAAEGEPRAS